MSDTHFPFAILLMGPTASGKTGVAVELIKHLSYEIVSVDSALVYRHMDIGTAKPDAATLQQAPHHLIDLIDPTQSYSAAQFRKDALRVMGEVSARGNIPLLVGGTMLYFKALLEGLSNLPQADADLRAELDERAKKIGWPAMHAKLAKLDPATAARIKPMDAQRIQRALEICILSGAPMSSQLGKADTTPLPYSFINIALVPSDRKVLHERITTRFDAMLKAGLVEEVKSLRQQFDLHPNLPSMRCVGYRQAWEYLDGEITKEELRDKGIIATRQLAKRQLTWLRSMEGVVEFDCLDMELKHKLSEYIRQQLATTSLPLQGEG
ncbi:MAG: tRNA (adenosine(37)-N6)-dimethylallyltransferase MiaA [Burkholderiales bacterium]